MVYRITAPLWESKQVTIVAIYSEHRMENTRGIHVYIVEYTCTCIIRILSVLCSLGLYHSSCMEWTAYQCFYIAWLSISTFRTLEYLFHSKRDRVHFIMAEQYTAQVPTLLTHSEGHMLYATDQELWLTGMPKRRALGRFVLIMHICSYLLSDVVILKRIWASLWYWGKKRTQTVQNEEISKLLQTVKNAKNEANWDSIS